MKRTMPFRLSLVPRVNVGVLFIYYFLVFTTAKDSPVRLPKTLHRNSCHEHCIVSPDGVHGLSCHGYISNIGKLESFKKNWMCVWESGKQASSQYTLYVLQRKTCKRFADISIMSQIITPYDLYEKFNMTVHVVEENVRNCTKAVFTGVPQDLVRCGPPTKVHFNRHSGQMEVNVSWQSKKMGINQYIVRYWTHENQSKETPTVLSRDVKTCIVDNLNASLPYEIQIQCVASEKGLCRQCLWSDIFRVSPELTVKPFIEEIKEIPQPEGRRIIVIKWKFAEADLAEGYRVTVEKLSGEPSREPFNTTRPEISLVLSHSAYLLNISAFHSAATSPALEWTIAPLVNKDLPPERLNVTFSGNSSFLISWQHDLVKTYNCFCVEWWRKGEKPAHKSFYEKENHYEVITLKEPLQPYERYTFTLHTRPDKDTCNLKKINNSEATYGSIYAYITEGRPRRAPGNIGSRNETQSSVMIEWDPVSEEDSMGFLLGYHLYYSEDEATHTETNLTVGPGSNSYELEDLKSSQQYQVQMSAFTRAGVGVRSSAVYFATNQRRQDVMTTGVALTTLVGLIIVSMFGCHISPLLIKRTKRVWWPNIPNPSDSYAIQNMKGVCELVLLEPIKPQNVEGEGDSSSLHLIEKVTEKFNISNFIRGFDSNLHCNREPEHMNNKTPLSETAREGLSDPSCGGVCQRDFLSTTTERIDKDLASVCATPSSMSTQHPDLSPISHQSHQAVFMSDYTTMELFQLANVLDSRPSTASADIQEQRLTRDEDFTSLRPELDYVRQSLCNALFLSPGGPVPPQSTEHYNTVL